MDSFFEDKTNSQLTNELLKLKEQNSYFLHFFKNINVGLIVIKNGCIIEANAKILSMLDYSSDDIKDYNLADLCHHEQTFGRNVIETLDNVSYTSFSNNIFISGWRLKTSTDSQFSCNLSISSVRQQNEVIQFVEVYEIESKQLTTQKIKEKTRQIESLNEERESLNEELRATLDELVTVNKQLTESETWNKSIVDNIPIGLMIINNGQVEYVNEKTSNIFGFPSNIEDFIVELKAIICENKDLIADFYDKLFLGANASDLEFWVELESGEMKFIRNQHVRFRGDNRWMIITTDLTEKQNAEDNLRFSEEKFRTIVQHLSDIILIVDKNLIIQYESPSVQKVFGYKPGFLLGKNSLELVHPDDIENITYEIKEVISKTNDYLPTETRVKNQSGEWSYLDIIGDNLLDHPAIKGILITARDITERKAHEVQLEIYSNHLEKLVKERTEEIEQINGELISTNEELKATNEELAEKNNTLKDEIIKRIEAQLLLEESENKFRSYIEQSTEGIALIDESGKIVDWNKSMETIFGIEKVDIIDTLVWEFDYRFMPEKRKTQKMFDELKNSIFTYLSSIEKNKVMTVEAVYDTIELKQKYLSVTIFPVITSKRKYVGRIVRDITGIKRAQEEIQKQSEELKEFNENLELQKSELEKALFELKRTQVQLVQSEKLASLGVLTAGVAHEINNPVNYINSALDGFKITITDFLQIFNKYEEIEPLNVKQKLAEIAKLKKDLDFDMLMDGINILLSNMKTGINRITEIVKSLRTFARVDENDLKLSDIHEIIDNTLVMLHSQYKNRVEIIKQYGTTLEINCYPGKLSQVFMNIFINALQAIPDSGEIIISTSTNNKFYTISIKDSGIGMSEEVKEKIFEPFFSTKEIGKGTGLGLSITYGIIQQHKGNIEVYSTLGKGTEFIVKIPIDLL